MTTAAKKEFWQMTRREVGAADLPPSVVESVLETHERAVKQAIAEGKDVPAEVLKDYPILQNSDNIITNKENEHGRENTGVLRRDNDIHSGATGNASDDVSQGRQEVQEHAAKRHEGNGETESGGGEARGRELNISGSAGLRGLAESDKDNNSGSEQRLTEEPPRPIPLPAKDIELNEHSDIGYNAGAASRFDANLAAIKTLKTIEDEHRQATPEEQAVLSRLMKMTAAALLTPPGAGAAPN